MEPLFLALQSQLEEINGTLRELKVENAVLRNEILGSGNSARTEEERVGILEKKTLREFVEEIQFDIKSMKREMQNANQRNNSVVQRTERTQDIEKKERNARVPGEFLGELPVVEIKQKTIEEERTWTKSKFDEERAKQTLQRKSNVVQQLTSFSDRKEHLGFRSRYDLRLGDERRRNESQNIVNVTRETQDEFSWMEIKQKTIKEERAWMKLKFDEERAKLPDPAVGASLAEKTVESISSSMPRPNREPSCVLKLSNHLNSDLLHPQEVVWRGSKKRGPTTAIVGHSLEDFSYQDLICIHFLLSFRVTNNLKLAVAFYTNREGTVTTVNLGFVPNNVPTDRVMISDMRILESVPDVCNGRVRGSTVEYFINHWNFLARAQVSPGPRSVVHLDILESGPTSLPLSFLNPLALNSLAELVEISNCLNVPLKNPRIFTRKRKAELSEALPLEVPPFTGQAFISLDNADQEGMFSYEIASTDLGLAVAYGFQGMNPTFSVAFVPLPAETDERAFNLAMDEEQWKSHLYRKYAHAKDGEQDIQIRNIRASVRMTVAEKPQLKIFIFTF